MHHRARSSVCPISWAGFHHAGLGCVRRGRPGVQVVRGLGAAGAAGRARRRWGRRGGHRTDNPRTTARMGRRIRRTEPPESLDRLPTPRCLSEVSLYETSRSYTAEEHLLELQIPQLVAPPAEPPLHAPQIQRVERGHLIRRQLKVDRNIRRDGVIWTTTSGSRPSPSGGPT